MKGGINEDGQNQRTGYFEFKNRSEQLGGVAGGGAAMIADRAVDILLVEDNPVDAELTIAALKARKLGHRIIHLMDGDQALDFICTSSMSANWRIESAPKVIILDLKLARMGGLEVLQQLKAEERTRPIPVVVLTGSVEQAELVESYRLGVNSYVVKPNDPRQYAQVVGDVAYYWLTVNRSFR